MNWRRGLFRLWITASVLWIVGWPVYIASTCARPSADPAHRLYCRADFGQWFPALDDFGPWEYATIAFYDLAPPLAVLLAGWAATWIITGFRRQPNP